MRSLYEGGKYQPYLGVDYTREIGDGPVPFELRNTKKEEIEIVYETYLKNHPLIKSMRVLPKNFKLHVIYPDEITVLN
jgi:hypothetical protein